MHEPRNEADLADIIKGAEGPLKIRGGGTRPIGNPVAGEVLATTGLSGIELYEPGALTIVAKSGTPLAEIEAALAAENQVLPFEPMDHRGLLGTNGEPTIGGVVAANVSGTRRIQAGRFRVNTTLSGGPELPLGGFKQSGWGREAGVYGVEEYTQIKSVHIEIGKRTPWVE